MSGVGSGAPVPDPGLGAGLGAGGISSGGSPFSGVGAPPSGGAVSSLTGIPGHHAGVVAVSAASSSAVASVAGATLSAPAPLATSALVGGIPPPVPPMGPPPAPMSHPAYFEVSPPAPPAPPSGAPPVLQSFAELGSEDSHYDRAFYEGPEAAASASASATPAAAPVAADPSSSAPSSAPALNPHDLPRGTSLTGPALLGAATSALTPTSAGGPPSVTHIATPLERTDVVVTLMPVGSGAGTVDSGSGASALPRSRAPSWDYGAGGAPPPLPPGAGPLGPPAGLGLASGTPPGSPPGTPHASGASAAAGGAVAGGGVAAAASGAVAGGAAAAPGAAGPGGVDDAKELADTKAALAETRAALEAERKKSEAAKTQVEQDNRSMTIALQHAKVKADLKSDRSRAGKIALMCVVAMAVVCLVAALLFTGGAAGAPLIVLGPSVFAKMQGIFAIAGSFALTTRMAAIYQGSYARKGESLDQLKSLEDAKGYAAEFKNLSPERRQLFEKWVDETSKESFEHINTIDEPKKGTFAKVSEHEKSKKGEAYLKETTYHRDNLKYDPELYALYKQIKAEVPETQKYLRSTHRMYELIERQVHVMKKYGYYPKDYTSKSMGSGLIGIASSKAASALDSVSSLPKSTTYDKDKIGMRNADSYPTAELIELEAEEEWKTKYDEAEGKTKLDDEAAKAKFEAARAGWKADRAKRAVERLAKLEEEAEAKRKRAAE